MAIGGQEKGLSYQIKRRRRRCKDKGVHLMDFHWFRQLLLLLLTIPNDILRWIQLCGAAAAEV